MNGIGAVELLGGTRGGWGFDAAIPPRPPEAVALGPL
jgi:hypothetical protein